MKKLEKRLCIIDDRENEKLDGINLTENNNITDRKMTRNEARINLENIQTFDTTTTPQPIHVFGYCLVW